MAAIRALTKDDVAAYRELRLEALRDSPEAFCSSYEEESVLPVNRFEARLQDNSIFGAFSDDGRLIGMVGFSRESRAKRAHGATLFGMHVSSGARRQGVGGALLDHALDFARRSGGVRTIKLSVMTANQEAFRLYRSRGFEIFGLERDALHVGEKYLDEAYLILKLDAA